MNALSLHEAWSGSHERGWLQNGPWPICEMAANGIMFMDPLPGFWSAAVVPYEPKVQQLSRDAAIAHLSN